MPNGGVDNCGECEFYPLSTVRLSVSPTLPREGARCDIPGVVVTIPFWTYCANLHTRSRQPDGPVFTGFHEWGRLPWHGSNELQGARDVTCVECGADGRLSVCDGEQTIGFCGGEHYVAWWQRKPPGSEASYPWDLHESMLESWRRAEGHDAPRDPG